MGLHGALDARWDATIARVHQGWPRRVREFKDQGAVYLGVIEEEGEALWVYRIYPAGRDGFGRPGRYFVVLFHLNSREQLLAQEVSGVLGYLKGERTWPLDPEPLEKGLPSAPPNPQVRRLHQQGHRKAGTHWGMDGEGSVVEFPGPVRSAASDRSKGWLRAGWKGNLRDRIAKPVWWAGVALVVTVAGLALVYFLDRGDGGATPPEREPKAEERRQENLGGMAEPEPEVVEQPDELPTDDRDPEAGEDLEGVPETR